VAVKDAAGADAAAERDWGFYCHAYGLQPTDLGRQFRSRSSIFRVVGVAPNHSKFPIEGECVHTKKRMLFTPYGVKAGLLPPVWVPCPHEQGDPRMWGSLAGRDTSQRRSWLDGGGL
jgi:hypothetical protein